MQQVAHGEVVGGHGLAAQRTAGQRRTDPTGASPGWGDAAEDPRGHGGRELATQGPGRGGGWHYAPEPSVGVLAVPADVGLDRHAAHGVPDDHGVAGTEMGQHGGEVVTEPADVGQPFPHDEAPWPRWS